MAAPITALYAGLLGLLLLALAINVVRGRAAFKVDFGDGGNPALLQRQRVHGNAVEYVPIGLVLLLLLELNGASAPVLHALGATLFVARVLHAWGLSTTTGRSPGRLLGTIATWLVLLSSGVLCLLTFFG
jgi:uncharacterized membrane protein YecN with MAPEG domain